MNKNVLLIMIVSAVLLVALVAGCASTKTVTVVVPGPAGPTGTLTKTITQIIGTQTQTTAVALSGPAPKIPHGSTVEGMYGSCFTCHPIPAGHTGRIANEDFCSQCHLQGEYLLAQ
jgi:hypothetical protein